MSVAKQTFPDAVPGGGGVVSPSTAAQLFLDRTARAVDAAQSAADSVAENLQKLPTYVTMTKAASANARQALLTAEQAARESFARRMGFSPAPAALGAMGGEVSLGLGFGLQTLLLSSSGFFANGDSASSSRGEEAGASGGEEGEEDDDSTRSSREPDSMVFVRGNADDISGRSMTRLQPADFL